MYPIPPTEKLVDTKTCRQCHDTFPITDKDLKFYENVSPVFGGKKYFVPTPTLCPDCRQQRRLAWRNERKLYKRKCDATGRDIISVFSPDKTYKVYHQDVWASDQWNPMDYGVKFDFERPFFEQFDELMHQVPQQGIMNVNCENSTYAQVVNGKNCYLMFVGGNAENILYSYWMVNAKNSVDCLRCQDIEESYDCIYCYDHCFSLTACFESKSSSYCSFCWSIVGCKDCFMSGNIINKQYYFRNVQLSKEQYEMEMGKIDIQKQYSELVAERNQGITKGIHKSNQNYGSLNSTGNYLKNSQNCSNCFEITETEDCKNFYDNGGNCKNCYDSTYGWKSENCYEMLGADGQNNIFGAMNIVNTHNSLYTVYSYNSKNIFGCIGVNHKEYCILNTQYTKDEYEVLMPKIIEHMRKNGEWGEFFPIGISPFGYNEAACMEHYPRDKNTVLESGFHWSDYEAPFPKVEKIIPASKLPPKIEDIPDDILNWAVECEVTKKPFRIIKQELEFYRKHHLPIPHRHPDQRHLDRMAQRNPRKLFERKCDKCEKDIITTYSPERKEQVYCEACYDREIVN